MRFHFTVERARYNKVNTCYSRNPWDWARFIFILSNFDKSESCHSGESSCNLGKDHIFKVLFPDKQQNMSVSMSKVSVTTRVKLKMLAWDQRSVHHSAIAGVISIHFL